MTNLVRIFWGDVGRIVAQIIGEGQSDTDALDRFRERFLTPRRNTAQQVIEMGMESGEFDAKLDPALAYVV